MAGLLTKIDDVSVDVKPKATNIGVKMADVWVKNRSFDENGWSFAPKNGDFHHNFHNFLFQTW